MPHNHKKNLCTFPTSTPELAGEAIEHALAAQSQWEALPFAERAAVFLKVSRLFFPFFSSFFSSCDLRIYSHYSQAADLISGKYRAKICAATMLGQGKNVWQAEIDAAAEVRFPFFDQLFLERNADSVEWKHTAR